MPFSSNLINLLLPKSCHVEEVLNPGCRGRLCSQLFVFCSFSSFFVSLSPYKQDTRQEPEMQGGKNHPPIVSQDCSIYQYYITHCISYIALLFHKITPARVQVQYFRSKPNNNVLKLQKQLHFCLADADSTMNLFFASSLQYDPLMIVMTEL